MFGGYLGVWQGSLHGVAFYYLRFSWSPVSLRCNRVPTASQTAAVEIKVISAALSRNGCYW